MTVAMFTLFLLALAVSLTGWGSLVLPHRRQWPSVFGAGTLLAFFLLAGAGWSSLLIPPVLWTLLSLGLLFWARPGRFLIPRGVLILSMCTLPVLPLALMPPASRDALIHHLYQARIWLDSGMLVRPHWAGHFSYPYLTETLYALAGGTFGFRVSRAVSLLGFVAACSVPAGFFLRRGRKWEATLSVLILLSIPELFRNASWSYSDSFLVFFSLLAYVELIRSDGNPFMAVVWSSAAACCKYNGLIVMASVMLLLPYYFRKLSLKRYLLLAGSAAFISAWWAIPNIIQWGNPVYPLLRGIFGPVYHYSARASDYFATASFSSSLQSMWDYILLPVRMSIHGEWNDPYLFDGASGPLLLAGAIISLPALANRRRKYLLPVLVMALTVLFKNSSLRTRYLLPGLAMLSVPTAQGLVRLIRGKGFVVKYATLMLITGCMVWSGLRVSRLYADQTPFRLQSDGEYLSSHLDAYVFMQSCGEYVSNGDTTYMLNMIRPFYFPGYAISSGSRAPLEFVQLFWSGMGSTEIIDSLKAEGVDHVAADMFLTSINVPTVLSSGELEEWREFVSLGLIPRLTLGRYVLFDLK